MTAHTDGAAAVVELLRAASAVLGEERAAQLRDALAERAGQLVRVGEAATIQFITGQCNEPALLTAAHWSQQVLGLNLAPPLQ